jgi:dipeptidyl aminopeptidase/acylaminoacyl peptidase
LRQLSILVVAACLAPPLHAQETFGGALGADLSIEAIEPDSSAVTTRPAGEYPADIARFLLARGAIQAKLSPDGRTVAFTWDITGQPELWTLPADGGQPLQLTFHTGIDGFEWTPDGQGLLYEADRNGNEQPGYFVITPDGRSEREVLPAARGDFRIFGDFAADGSFVYSSTVRNQLDFDIYRATLSGEVELVREGRYAFTVPSISPDGRFAVVLEAVGEDANNLYLLDLAGKDLTTISAPDPRASHDAFAWREDSSGFFFSTNAGREFAALSYYDRATGGIDTLVEAGHDIGGVQLCGPDDRFLAWTVNEDGFSRLHLRERASGATRSIEGLPEGVYSLDCQGEPALLLVRISGWRTPGALWTVDPASGAAREVFAPSLAGLDPERLVRPQVVRYAARDGVTLQGLLYLPAGAGRGADAPPVLFSVHGGPSAQSVSSFDPAVQYYVNRGLAVFLPNVRGSTGLGRSYSALDDREKRLDSVRDLVDLLDALGSDGLVDASRAAVAGGSYGGYMVNAVLAAYPEAFVAGVSLFGVGDWITALEVASPALKASDLIEYGDISDPRWREFYRVNSPVRQADRIRVPVLYSHGVQDPRIDVSETETMVKALRERGIEAPFVRIPDEGHGWRKLSNQLFYYRQEAAFIDEHLKQDAD